MDTCTVAKINNNTNERVETIYYGTWSEIHPSRYECSYSIPSDAKWHFKLANDISNELETHHLDIDDDFLDYDDNGVLGWFSITKLK